MENLATFFASLGNPIRLMVVEALIVDKELNVGQLFDHIIANKVNITQGALSQHLAKLRDSGIVQTRRESTTIYYSLVNSKISTVLRAANAIQS